ncbi:uncharacterized protein LOC128218935 isoform X2 [Mya arenaria]|uniref:uncharacterized protein LOC128218935 isoform X2 n=1 Tax=Mya arenaria TaxID=6604 RepID=UPI0022E8C5BE|nr:uncharacterized protein LOC128218935 isoform X2 [Mya arenaria]
MTTFSILENRSDFFADSDEYHHKSFKKRCLIFLIIMFIFALLAAAIVPAVLLTKKKDSDDSPDVLARVDMQTKITNFNFTLGLNDNTSDEYYNFTHSFCDQIIAKMTENNEDKNFVKDLIGCTVWSLSPGSVVVKFTVVISHEGNKGSPTSAEIKILVGVDGGNTGTVELGIYTIDVETFHVQAVLVVTVNNSPLPTLVSYGSNCKSGDECETYFARCLDGKCACKETKYHNSIDDSCLIGKTIDGIGTINEINISKDGKLYNSTLVGHSTFTGILGQINVQVDATAKTASFGIANVSCENEGSYLVKIDSLSEEIIVKVLSQPKQPEISVPVSSYVNQEMIVQCMGYVGRTPHGAATRLQLQSHAADENEFIVYGVVPTNQSKECSETTCECYETLLFLIFPTLPMNKTVLRCASLASDGSLMVSSEAKALSLVPRDIYFTGEDVTAAIGSSINLECVLLNGQGANGAIVYFNHNNSVVYTELCVVSQSGVGNCTVDKIWAYADNIDSSVKVNIIIENITCSDVGRYICKSIVTATSAASINLGAFG